MHNYYINLNSFVYNAYLAPFYFYVWIISIAKITTKIYFKFILKLIFLSYSSWCNVCLLIFNGFKLFEVWRLWCHHYFLILITANLWLEQVTGLIWIVSEILRLVSIAHKWFHHSTLRNFVLVLFVLRDIHWLIIVC